MLDSQGRRKAHACIFSKFDTTQQVNPPKKTKKRSEKWQNLKSFPIALSTQRPSRKATVLLGRAA